MAYPVAIGTRVEFQVSPEERVLIGLLMRETGVQDPERVLRDAWKYKAQQVFGKVRYRRWMETWRHRPVAASEGK